MRTFSKIVFICNVCFIIAAIFRIIEMFAKKNGNSEALIPLPFLVATVVLLGTIVSFIFDLIFITVVAIQKALKRPLEIPAYILYFNLLMLPVEIWYFFIWGVR
jgi:hypothetical protein